MFIHKESDSSYILAESTQSRDHSVRITKNYTWEEWDINKCESYYDLNPNKRFECFENEKAYIYYERQMEQYEMLYKPLCAEYDQLISWFTLYDQQVQQYNRAVRLNLPYDAKYGTIEELDAQAVINAQRLNTLRAEIKELEKTKPIEPTMK